MEIHPRSRSEGGWPPQPLLLQDPFEPGADVGHLLIGDGMAPVGQLPVDQRVSEAFQDRPGLAGEIDRDDGILGPMEDIDGQMAGLLEIEPGHHPARDGGQAGEEMGVAQPDLVSEGAPIGNTRQEDGSFLDMIEGADLLDDLEDEVGIPGHPGHIGRFGGDQ